MQTDIKTGPQDKRAQTKQALRAMLAAMQPAEILDMMRQEGQCALHEEEAAKTHPLTDYRMADADFAALREHLMDGGGVTDASVPSKDDRCLTNIVLQAIFESDQATFWQELPHLVKMWMNDRGLISRDPGGLIKISGIGLPPGMSVPGKE
jgi:hypothetical protein